MKIELQRLDWKLFGPVLVLLVIGLWMVFDSAPRIAFQKQCLAVGLGLLLCFFVASLDYRFLEGFAWIAYGIGIGLLILVLFLGKPVRGSRSWFFFGPFSFQPSSLATLGWIFALARYIANCELSGYSDSLRGGEKGTRINQFSSLLVIGLLSIVPVALIFLQPDLGSGLIFLPILVVLLWVGRVKIGWLISVFSFVGICLGVVFGLAWFQLQAQRSPLTGGGRLFLKIFSHWFYILPLCVIIFIMIWGIYYILNQLRVKVELRTFLFSYAIIVGGIITGCVLPFFLKGYQQKRILAFWAPELDPLGAGYNIIQSKIAIGAGGLFGKGFFQGSQSQLGFLPARYTDFIFAVVAEEGGIVFSMLVLGAIFFLTLRGLQIARIARDTFGTLLASGITAMICFYSIINIGMTVGLFPVTGLPLPFVSYGGSSLITNLIAIGVLLNIFLHRFSY